MITIKARKKPKIALLLKHVPYIYHSLCFKKDWAKIQSLINSDNEINTITLAYVAKLSLQIWSINVKP